ncbi:c-type cytochrome [uncultured Cocleimonas sp.]|uniref:c-type cytochrome n=1 Tax=uncultured Cocleimonas sp. TaxID=1051587 RepID=UPI0026364FF6|nr:c-type cytochrome [uncultured Cocleimonas sp.]
MKLTKTLIATALTFFSYNAFASENENNAHEEGEKLYQAQCESCHGATGGMDIDKRIAPPIAGVRMHYVSVHPDKDAFVAAVSGWLASQDEAKSLMPGAIQRFKLMPPLEIALEDAEKIAAYIYEGDIEKLEGFDKHVEEMHGKGMQGMTCNEMQGKGQDEDQEQGQGQSQGQGMNCKGMHGKGMYGKGQGMHGKGMNGKGMQGNGQGMYCKGMHGMGQGMYGKGMNGKAMHGMGKGMHGNNMHGMNMPNMGNMAGNGMHGMMPKMGTKPRGPGISPADMKAKLMQQFNLSAEQMAKMETLMQEKSATMQSLSQQQHALKQKFMALDTSSPSYKADIFALAKEEATLASRKTVEKGEMRFKMDSLLSPEQRQRFAQMRARKTEMKQRMRQRIHHSMKNRMNQGMNNGMPSNGMPNMSMPSMRMPSSEMPSWEMYQGQMPEMKMPTIGNPPLSIPEMEKPEATAPEATPPKSE